ncbi:L-2-amino-thiazoline-4-carboxylic acid hydrolase [Paenactinomyces guangxiensis]|uniref:L-2-amino-thiazoline-4-carboxylic acid hydrolase n=1 Tax=Paenactinomyces guangxiensis TaxID=1490290 RepID=A0A7W1WRZ2_9BACL|nr:L-2-amino-thiazoline-4-carboxylic acid hydrolase [Paenactinomyces guangxiensis]MBA4494980.1 L-2-amino-thiazoline-4-carboxylic acid hydrolase [Paenactinomyces guangxiensis]MBH8592063.1 L-2-amino-thiazoline-4-carboxylic acid hydrolase [Paenactinomyces guangxiensis]
MSSRPLPMPPLSMYSITAKLFTHLHRSILSAFGEEGRVYIQKAVEQFGYKDLDDIAKRASAEGEEHVLDQYIPKSYDSKNLYGSTTIYGLMAKLFAQISKAVSDRFGEEGKNAIREGVRTFGEERGRGIKERAAHMGEKNTIDHYLSNYDMGRSDLFEYENEFKPGVIEQTFTKCPFGQQWADDNMHEYGILYCEMIDPAVARGYNPDFEVVHDKYILREGKCHFEFKLGDSEQND